MNTNFRLQIPAGKNYLAMDPHDVTRLAIADDVKDVARGMGKGLQWIYKILSEPRHDPYTRFITLYNAVGQEGADLFFEDFRAMHYARKYKEQLQKVSWDQTVLDSIKETGEAIAAAVKNGEVEEMAVELIQGISMLRLLLALTTLKSDRLIEIEEEQEAKVLSAAAVGR